MFVIPPHTASFRKAIDEDAAVLEATLRAVYRVTKKQAPPSIFLPPAQQQAGGETEAASQAEVIVAVRLHKPTFAHFMAVLLLQSWARKRKAAKQLMSPPKPDNLVQPERAVHTVHSIAVGMRRLKLAAADSPAYSAAAPAPSASQASDLPTLGVAAAPVGPSPRPSLRSAAASVRGPAAGARAYGRVGERPTLQPARPQSIPLPSGSGAIIASNDRVRRPVSATPTSSATSSAISSATPSAISSAAPSARVMVEMGPTVKRQLDYAEVGVMWGSVPRAAPASACFRSGALHLCVRRTPRRPIGRGRAALLCVLVCT
jgi:hypothetical protein